MDPSWATLDLGACTALRARTLAAILAPLQQLRELDLSECMLTNHIVYSMPGWLPQLRHLRLEGAYRLVERAAWQALVPSAGTGTATDSWEDEAADERCTHSRCSTSLQ